MAIRLTFGGVVGLALSLVGCTKTSSTNPSTSSPSASTGALSVKTARPTPDEIERLAKLPGRVEPYEQTAIFARVAGYAHKVYVDRGDIVKEGAPLVELAAPELVEELSQKEALVKQARAEVDQAKAAETAAGAAVGTAAARVAEVEAQRGQARADYDRWQSEHQRIEGLVARRVLDVQTGAETLNQFRSAEAVLAQVGARVMSAQASHRESEAKHEKARADRRAAEARVEVALADQKRVAELVGYTVLRAPFPGVITARYVDTGAYVAPGGTAKGQPLLLVTRNDKVRICLEVSEGDADWVRPGVEARIQLQAWGNREFVDRVTRTSWAITPPNNTLHTQIERPNTVSSTGNGLIDLRAGMNVGITLRSAQRVDWSLPATAIGKGDTPFCYRVVAGKAIRTDVQTGLRANQRVEVLRWRDGPSSAWRVWSGSEIVIVSGLADLSDGASVEVQ